MVIARLSRTPLLPMLAGPTRPPGTAPLSPRTLLYPHLFLPLPPSSLLLHLFPWLHLFHFPMTLTCLSFILQWIQSVSFPSSPVGMEFWLCSLLPAPHVAHQISIVCYDVTIVRRMLRTCIVSTSASTSLVAISTLALASLDSSPTAVFGKRSLTPLVLLHPPPFPVLLFSFSSSSLQLPLFSHRHHHKFFM